MTFDHHAVLQLAAPLQPKSDISDLGHLWCRTRASPSSDGERSDRACAIRVRGAGSITVCDPLTRNVRAQRAHSDLSPAGRGKPRLPQRQETRYNTRLADSG